jgi:hypothetical protein
MNEKNLSIIYLGNETDIPSLISHPSTLAYYLKLFVRFYCVTISLPYHYRP